MSAVIFQSPQSSFQGAPSAASRGAVSCLKGRRLKGRRHLLKGRLQGSALLYGPWVLVDSLVSAVRNPAPMSVWHGTAKRAAICRGEATAPASPPTGSAPERWVTLTAQISKEGAEWLCMCSADIVGAQIRIGGARAPTEISNYTPDSGY